MKKYIEKLQQNSLKLTQPSTSSLEYKSHYKELYKFLDLKLGYWPLLVHFLIKSRVKEYIEKVTRNSRSKGQNPSRNSGAYRAWIISHTHAAAQHSP